MTRRLTRNDYRLSLSVAIAGSAALSLFLELAVIRWQGSIFEFFSFYKNYGLLPALRVLASDMPCREMIAESCLT